MFFRNTKCVQQVVSVSYVSVLVPVMVSLSRKVYWLMPTSDLPQDFGPVARQEARHREEKESQAQRKDNWGPPPSLKTSPNDLHVIRLHLKVLVSAP